MDIFEKMRRDLQVGEPEEIDFSLSIGEIHAGKVKRQKLWNEKKQEELPGRTE